MKTIIYENKNFSILIKKTHCIQAFMKIKGVDKIKDKQYPFILSVIEGKRFQNFLKRNLHARHIIGDYDNVMKDLYYTSKMYTSWYIHEEEEKERKYREIYEKEVKERQEREKYNLPYFEINKGITMENKKNGIRIRIFSKSVSLIDLNVDEYIVMDLKKTDKEGAKKILKAMNGCTFENVEQEWAFEKHKDAFVSALRNIAGWESKVLNVNIE
jgi:hypothetical protein